MRVSLLFLVFSLASPVEAWTQNETLFAPGVKVLAALETSVFDWSPDGKHIGYVTNDGIWIAEAPEFSHPRRVVRKGSCAAGSCPAPQLVWSPDGKHLAFMDSRPGDGWSTIWVMNADGAEVRDLLPVGAPFGSPGSRAVFMSAWLNNGEVAFGVHCGTGCVSLNKVAIDDLSYEHFCIGNMDGGFYWTPTRNRVVGELHLGGLSLTEQAAATLTTEESLWDSCQEKLRGCQFQQEEWQGLSWQVDAWSPDSKQVLYTGHACEGGDSPHSGSALYRWEVDSGRQERLLANAGWGAWSPDGSQIAFLLFGQPSYDSAKRVLRTDFSPGKPLRMYLGILEVATNAVSTLMPLSPELLNPEKVPDWNMFRPVWAPDGKRLVARNLQKDLILVWADGSRHQPLTQAVRPEAYCDSTCTQWSPNGKWLAVLPTGKVSNLGEGKGLARFLPPVGKEDAALSDAEVIQRYFEHILAQGPQTYAPFLGEYIRALEAMGQVETAQEQYRRAIEIVQHAAQWRDTSLETELKQSYAEFLCRQGRATEAAEWGVCQSPSAWPHQEDLQRDRSALFASRVSPWRNGAAEEHQTPPQPLEASPPQASRFPVLYIIEVPE